MAVCIMQAFVGMAVYGDLFDLVVVEMEATWGWEGLGHGDVGEVCVTRHESFVTNDNRC